MEVIVELSRTRFFIASFHKGELLARELPLEDVSLSSSLEAGDMRASLDLRKVARDIPDAVDVLSMLELGGVNVVPVREEPDGTQTALGEWWLTRRDRSHADPVIKLAGVELHGYGKSQNTRTRWTAQQRDPVATIRGLWIENCTDGQIIQCDFRSWSSSLPKVDYNWKAGTVSYWDAMSTLAGDDCEWWVRSDLELADGAPYRVKRTLLIGVPTIRTPRDDVMLEAVSPGGYPGTVLDTAEVHDATVALEALHAYGGGAGYDQMGRTAEKPRPPGPRRTAVTSSVMVSRTATTEAMLQREVAAALAAMQPAAQVFTATSTLPLQLGDVVAWSREPSWAMPVAEEGMVRCVGWSWKQPATGARETFELQLVREA